MTVAQTLGVTGTVTAAGVQIAANALTPASGSNFGLCDRVTATVTIGKGPVSLSFSGSQTYVRGTLQVDQAATFSSTVQATAFKVGGTQVVGAQQGAVADCNINNLNDIGTKLNLLLAALRLHGLIA